MTFMKIAAASLIAFSAFSCKHLSNRIESLTFECGKGSNNKRGSYLKIQDKNGNDLSSESFVKLEAGTYHNSHFTDLEKTESGCILVPESDGTIFLNSPSLQQSIAIEKPKEDFARIQLEDYSDTKLTLNCPARVISSNTTLGNPWTTETSSNYESLEIELKIIAKKNDFEKTLFKKKFGEKSLKVPAQFDISDFPEGEYSLTSRYENLANGVKSLKTIKMDKIEECVLAIIHSNKDSKYFALRNSSFTTNSEISLNSTLQKNDVFTCFEERLEVSHQKECGETSKSCDDVLTFSKNQFRSPPKSGIYDFSRYTVDSAGNRSQIECDTLVISDSKPSIRALWIEKDLNSKPSMMSWPLSSLETDIQLTHPIVSSSQLLTSLECKADFLMQGQYLVSGENLTCESGKCKGLSLGSFVPCDSRMTISLRKAWDQTTFGRSLLRLHVRANDGAGNIGEAQLTTLVNDSRWKAGPAKEFKDCEGESDKLWFKDDILCLLNGVVTHISDSKKVQIAPPAPDFSAKKMLLGNREIPLIIWNSTVDRKIIVSKISTEDQKIIFEGKNYEYDDTFYSDNEFDFIKLKKFETDESTNKVVSRMLAVGENTRFISIFRSNCKPSDNEIAYLEKTSSIFVICDNKVFEATKNTWKEATWLNHPEKTIASEIVKTSSNDLLAVFQTNSGNLQFLVDVNTTEKSSVFSQLTDLSQWIPSQWILRKNFQGEIYKGVSKWDVSQRKMIDDSLNLKIFPGRKASRSLAKGSVYEFNDENGTFVKSPDETIYYPSLPDGFVSTQGFDKNILGDFYNFVGYSQNGSSYYKLNKAKFAKMGSGFAGLTHDVYLDISIDSERNLHAAHRKGEFIFKDNIWRLSNKSPALKNNLGRSIFFDKTSIEIFGSSGESISKFNVDGVESIYEDDNQTIWFVSKQKLYFIEGGTINSFKMESEIYGKTFKVGNSLFFFIKNDFILYEKSLIDKQAGIVLSSLNSKIEYFQRKCTRPNFRQHVTGEVSFLCSTTDSIDPLVLVLTSASDGSMKVQELRLPPFSNSIMPSDLGQIEFDKSGRIFAMRNNSIFMLNNTTWTPVLTGVELDEFKPGMSIQNFAIDSDYNLWLAVVEGGAQANILLFTPDPKNNPMAP